MDFWQRVHWFATPECNERCRFCFKPDFEFLDSPEVVSELAHMLVEGGVKEVVYTGGEPTLLRNLSVGLDVLHNAGVDTSIHTNATTLTPKKRDQLVGIVDEVAVPIDSMNRQTQKYLRKMDCLPKVMDLLEQLQNKPVRIEIHTVATSKNIDHIPKIYEYLQGRRFDSWRIYEYNSDLVSDRLSSVKRFMEVEELNGSPVTIEDGGVNCLYSQFLLMEEQMSGHEDGRIQFVGVSDYSRQPYFFLNTAGDVHFCNWFLQGKRKYVGNSLAEGFDSVRDRMVEADQQGPLFDEDSFIDTEHDQPLWVRAAWEGNFFPEELEDVRPGYHGKFMHLSRLYLDRSIKQGYIPEGAELLLA